MNRKITTECSEELYNQRIKPYIERGYDESDVAATLMMLGAARLEDNPDSLKDFELALGMIRFAKLMAEVLGK